MNVVAEEQKVFLVPVAAYGHIEHKIELLNRRARKFGSAEAVIEILGTKDVTHYGEEGRKYKVRSHEISLSCEPVKLAGWTLIAALDRVRTSKLVDGKHERVEFTTLRPVPGHEVPAEYRNRDACDHCNKPIARKTTYLVEHEDGRTKQVGGNCLADFLGHDPERIIWGASFVSRCADAFDEENISEYSNCIRESVVYPAEEFLIVVAKICRIDGWLSRGKAYEKQICGEATADKALREYCRENNISVPPKEWEPYEFLPEDKEQARAALEWARGISEDEKNEYRYNLGLVARFECIDSKQVGIGASLIAAYAKEQEKELNQQKFQHIASGYVGEIKKREDFEIEVLSARHFENDWGLTIQYRLVTPDNFLLVWWASDGAQDRLEEGKSYKVKATVKKHDEYNGKKQTIINRVKILESNIT